MQSVLVRPQSAIVRPCSDINAATVAEFQHQLTEAMLSEQHSVVVVDLSQVESLDSAGLMVLVSALNLSKVRQKQLCLCSMSVSIRLIFELTQLDQVFDIVESVAVFEAIAV
jgi:anti-sigma B factor antagonist